MQIERLPGLHPQINLTTDARNNICRFDENQRPVSRDLPPNDTCIEVRLKVKEVTLISISTLRIKFIKSRSHYLVGKCILANIYSFYRYRLVTHPLYR